MSTTTPTHYDGRTYRSAHLLHSYFNVFPTVACFRSHLTAQQRFLSHFSLGKQWTQDLIVHRAFFSLPRKYQRALSLLYDESYQFRPGTAVGELYRATQDILGKTHRLLLIQPILPDLKGLTRIYTDLSKSRLGPGDKIIVFKLGVYLRDLYQEAHQAFYNAFLSFGGKG